LGETGADRTTSADACGAGRGEAYTHGYGADVVAYHAQRSAAREAAFLLPHLRPGMRLLDLGCGPGTITLGLAQLVAPGEAVGVDLGPAVIERARAEAAARGVPGVRFEVASAYALPFPAASFDAAFASAVLEHLADPAAALAEVRRVLRPGGVLGVRDTTSGSWGLMPPAGPPIERLVALYRRFQEHNGGHPEIGRRHRALLRAAGFVRTEASASATWHGTREATRQWGEMGAGLLEGGHPAFVAWALSEGGVAQAELAALAAAARAWGADPDAFEATLWGEAVGWAPDGGSSPGAAAAHET